MNEDLLEDLKYFTCASFRSLTIPPSYLETGDGEERNELEVLRAKYPALQQAWDHYQIVLRMCEAQEQVESK